LARQITILKAQKKALIVLSANLKLGLIALGSIAVLAAIKALADGLRGPEERLRAMQQRLAEAKKGFDDLAKAGHVAELTSQLTQARQEETAAERALLQAQARSRRTVTETGMMEPTSVSTEREELRLQETIERRVALEKSLRNAERVAAPSLPPPELQAIPLAPSDLTGGAGAADDAAREAEKRQRELERLQNQQQQMILANAELQAKLQEIEFNEGKDIAEEKFNFVKRLIDAEYDYRLSKANEIQAVQLRLEKQLSDSRLSALESVENALMRIEEARFRSKIAGQKVEAAKQFDALQEQQPSAVPGALPGAPDAPVLPLPSGGGQSFQPSSKARALMAAAQTLGVSPLDLATIIGFETGGSYSPSQWGGEGGNYMGLIQFGGPERRQYGANANQSFEEQVQGPVVRYFQDRFRGVGMSTQGATLEDLYTTVLAGNPRANRNARDSFGTSPRSGVAAMGAHRQRALQMFFGGSMANVGAVGPMSGPAFSVEKRSQKAEDEQVVAQREEDAVRTVALLRLNNELQASIKQSRAEIAEAVGAALPISQLELENQLLEQRNALVLQGASEEQIELEQNKAIAQSKSASVQEALRKAISEAESGLKSYDKRLADGAITQEVYDIAITGINDRLKMLRESLGEIDPALERYNAQLLRAKEINDSMEPQLRIATALNEARKEMKSLLDPSQQLITVASGIGNAFGDAFKGLVSGASSARETMANFFQSISNVFTDMLARIIAEWAKIQLIQGLSGFLPGLGSFAGGAGFGGPVLLPTGADIGAGGGILQNAQGQGFGTLGPNFGFRQFATGGIVKGPTLGLVGEGRFNEAVVPLPDGKSIPVELGKDGGNQIISNITITVNDGKAQSSSSGGGSSEFGKRMESAVKQVIVNELRPGGVLSGRR
jgi:hypothetical protein